MEEEEVMVSEKPHCLKPPLKNLSCSSSDLSSRISFSGFWFAEFSYLSWLEKMEALHKPTWQKSEIFEAIKASTQNIYKNPNLILSIAEKWCSETNTFVFPWGEATVTLEDVNVLLGFSVLGSPVFTSSLETSEKVKKLEKVWIELSRTKNNRGGVSQNSWISSFLDKDDDDVEHEAFLVLWLSLFVFPGTSRRSISKHVIPIAVRLARGERLALAPTVLANLYRDLSKISVFMRTESYTDSTLYLRSLFKLLQVWIYERFKNARPVKVSEIPSGESRIAQWLTTSTSSKQNQTMENQRFDVFEWRPYTKPLKNWNPLRFYLEEAMSVTIDDEIDDEFTSFGRFVTVSQLPGDGFVEAYNPNRVLRQFGLDQDLPEVAEFVEEEEGWDTYNKSLIGLNLDMPGRNDEGSVTERYKDWWVECEAHIYGNLM